MPSPLLWGTTGEHAAIIYAAKATVFLLAIKFNCRFLTRADPPDTLTRCHVSPIETGASPQNYLVLLTV